MALTNLEDALNELSDAELIPTPPPPPVDNTWDPPVNAIRVIIKNYFVPAVENKTPRGELFKDMIEIAYTQYNKVITRRQLKEIWDAWRAEIAERQAAP